MAAGKITDTAIAASAAANEVPVTSNTARMTVPEWWPGPEAGTYQPPAGAWPGGYYLGVYGSTWVLYVTHPGHASVSFTGQVSVPAGTLSHLRTHINPAAGQQVTLTGNTITFTLPNTGQLTGFSFTTGTTVTSITFTLNINGQPAGNLALHLGAFNTQSATGSPLTFTR
jgi:hypothetical protein